MARVGHTDVTTFLSHGPEEGKWSGRETTQAWPSAGDGPEEGFRGPQVCNIVGITYRQLDYWARTDLLRPSISDARGSGTQRVYSYTDLLQLKVIKQLLDAGVSLRQTRKAIECLRASGAGVASASLVIADDRSVLAHSGEELFDLLRGGQGVLEHRARDGQDRLRGRRCHHRAPGQPAARRATLRVRPSIGHGPCSGT